MFLILPFTSDEDDPSAISLRSHECFGKAFDPCAGGMEILTHEDAFAGVPLLSPHQVTRPGHMVILEASSSVAGVLTLQASKDGLAWYSGARFDIEPDKPVGLRFLPELAQWRTRFITAAASTSLVLTFGQSRPSSLSTLRAHA